MLVQLSKRPEFAIVGMKCKVLINNIGELTNVPAHIFAPAYIVQVTRRNNELDSITVNIRKSSTYNNRPIENYKIFSDDFDNVFVDSAIENVREFTVNDLNIICEAL